MMRRLALTCGTMVFDSLAGFVLFSLSVAMLSLLALPLTVPLSVPLSVPPSARATELASAQAAAQASGRR